MSKDTTLSDVQPKPVMSEAELEAWEALPADVQLERLRAAIDKGYTSGISNRTMDEIFEEALKRHPNAKL